MLGSCAKYVWFGHQQYAWFLLACFMSRDKDYGILWFTATLKHFDRRFLHRVTVCFHHSAKLEMKSRNQIQLSHALGFERKKIWAHFEAVFWGPEEIGRSGTQFSHMVPCMVMLG